MKKTALILLILIMLCAIVAAGFYYITQRGLLARNIYLYDKKTEIEINITDGPSQLLLLDAVKSNEKLADTNINSAFLDSKINLEVLYWPDITMNYEISYNHYNGVGTIKKGLLEKHLFTIPAKTMDYILSPETITIARAESPATRQSLAESEYSEIMKDLTYLEGKPEMQNDPIIYEIEVITIHGTTLKYNIDIDMSSRSAFLNTTHGYYSLSEKSTQTLMSLETIYTDYQALMQPLPHIYLSISSVKNPFQSEKNWTRIKPSGEVVLENTPASYDTDVENLTTGQKIEVVYNPEIKPDAIILYEYKNMELTNAYNLMIEDVYVPEYEGELLYSLKAIYESTTYPESYGTITNDYSFTIKLPTQASIKYSQVRPGDILAFYIKFADEGEAFSLESNLGNFKADFMPHGEDMVLYMPVNWWTSPKDYSATIYKKTGSTKEVFSTYKFTILPDNFETIYQQLVVSNELAKKADPVNTANDAIVIKEAKSHSNETSYLDGLFIMPLNGAHGTSFGQTRYINGENPYRHSGLDIDGDTGDPIVAANRGEIVFAGELVRTGNTVIIDHGMQLFSSYLHMSAFDVKAGDFVEKGDLIGKVGSTGFSTGPHLHWSITLYGNYMSPLWLVENSLVPD